MERRYQCSIHVLLCDGGWDSWLEAAWKYSYGLAVTVVVVTVVFCSSTSRIQQGGAEQICLINLACSDLFTCLLLLLKQNDWQGIKGFSFWLRASAVTQQDEVDQVAC